LREIDDGDDEVCNVTTSEDTDPMTHLLVGPVVQPDSTPDSPSTKVAATPHSPAHQHYSPHQIENYTQDYIPRIHHEIAAEEDNDVRIPLPPAAAVVAVAAVEIPSRRDRTEVVTGRGTQGTQTLDLPVRVLARRNRQRRHLGLVRRIVASSGVAFLVRWIGVFLLLLRLEVVQVVAGPRNSFFQKYCPRYTLIGRGHRWRIGLCRRLLVVRRSQILRSLDRRTCPCVGCSTGMRRSVVGTFGWRSTGVSSTGSCWDCTVDDEVVGSVWRGWALDQWWWMQRAWNLRIDLAWFEYRR